MRTLREDGFTLIELLIAMTIFAVGLLSLAGMQITAIRTNSDANVRTASAALAEGILEEMLSMPANAPRLNANASNQPWLFSGGTTTKVLPGAGTYQATYSVVVGAPPTPALSRVTVVVRGPGPDISLTGFKRTGN